MNKKVFYCIIAIFLLYIRCSSEAQEEILTFALKSESLYLESSIDMPRRSEGDVLMLNDSIVYLVYTKFTGGAGDHDKAVLVKRLSQDRGKSWSDEVELIGREGKMNVMSASLLRLKDNRLALFYLVKNSVTDCYPAVRFSSDDGETWSDPTACIPPNSGYYTVNNSRVIQLSSGRIVVPVSFFPMKNGEWTGNGILRCYFSDDNGTSWKKGNSVPLPANLIAQEPGVVELLNGAVLMYMRTDKGVQYFSYSKDGGHSWSFAEASTISSPLSPASIVRNPYNRSLMIVWNKSTSERMPLCLAKSEDEGSTWNDKMLLENRQNFWACYPAIEFISPNELFVLYSLGTKEKWGLESLKLIRVKYE